MPYEVKLQIFELSLQLIFDSLKLGIRRNCSASLGGKKGLDFIFFTLFLTQFDLNLSKISIYYKYEPKNHFWGELKDIQFCLIFIRLWLFELSFQLIFHSGWVDELREVLWAIRTTNRTPIGETLFSMAFDAEAMSPIQSEYFLRVDYTTMMKNEMTSVEIGYISKEDSLLL